VADERHDLHLGARLIPDLVSRLVERLLVARAERDARPLAGKPEGDRAPDAAARPTDERRFPFEAGVHGRIVEEPGARRKKGEAGANTSGGGAGSISRLDAEPDPRRGSVLDPLPSALLDCGRKSNRRTR